MSETKEPDAFELLCQAVMASVDQDREWMAMNLVAEARAAHAREMALFDPTGTAEVKTDSVGVIEGAAVPIGTPVWWSGKDQVVKIDGQWLRVVSGDEAAFTAGYNLARNVEETRREMYRDTWTQKIVMTDLSLDDTSFGTDALKSMCWKLASMPKGKSGIVFHNPEHYQIVE